VRKYFGKEIRKLGFKGKGLDYFMGTDDFLFAFIIDGASKWWSGSCAVSMVIHPKVNSEKRRWKAAKFQKTSVLSL